MMPNNIFLKKRSTVFMLHYYVTLLLFMLQAIIIKNIFYSMLTDNKYVIYVTKYAIL